MAKRRFNDMGYSGWLSVLSIIPLLNLIIGLMLICKRGDEFRNAYGKPPGPNSGWIWLAILAIPLIGILAAIALPAYQSFTKRAGQAAQSQQAPIAAPAESNGAGKQ